MVLNKIDLLPYVQFDVDRCLDYARQVNPHLRMLQSRRPAATAWRSGMPGYGSRWAAAGPP